MCRWLAYSGSPVLLERLLYTPVHSLIDQSLHSKLGATTTNGDGFGVGWYGEDDAPALFKSVEPAWNDKNLRELAGQVRSGLVFAHIRAATGTPVQWTNCHPFRHGRWLWMHNGAIAQFQEVKRELQLAVDPSLYSAIEGSTDSETFFFLALTFGLEDDPPAPSRVPSASSRRSGDKHGVEHPIQMTVATTDGKTSVGVPLFERRQVALALLLDEGGHSARALSRSRGDPGRRRRGAAHRLGAAARPPRRLERGAGVELRHRPAGAGRAPPIPATGERELSRWR